MKLWFTFLLSLAVVTAAAAQDAASIGGRWDAVVVVNGTEVPFRFDVDARDGIPRGAFVNGTDRIMSTQGRLADGALTLQFEQYGSTLSATLANGELTGVYDRRSRGRYPFRAVRHRDDDQGAAGGEVPRIDGEWRIPTTNNKGETAWRFLVRQDGADVEAAILRVDGDTGTLSGRYASGTFVLSHFSGARPMRLEVTPQADGSLTLLQNGTVTLTAVREDDTRAAGTPSDPLAHTRMKNPDEPLRFRFPDHATGEIVANDDPRFAGKVVLVSITGSWCPNCHDEAPFLSELYATYKDKGLEIVGLSYEEEEELEDPARLRAFVKQYSLPYTFLLAGTPDQVAESLPQAENLNSVPTTFLLGRDGRVRWIHAGFPSAASGEFFAEAKRDIPARVERALAEPAR